MRPHPDALLLAFALAGVVTLHAAGALLAPPAIAGASLPEHEGARVALEALVLEAHPGARGRFLVVADATARVPVLAGPGEGPAPGDLVRVVGVVTRLDAGLGVSAQRVEVVLPAASRALDPGELAREPERHEGARVLVRGEVRGDALVGLGARVRLLGEACPEPSGAWLAAGTWRYRESDAAYALVVDAWTRPS